MSSLEKYQAAVRSGLHPETAKAFEPKPEPIKLKDLEPSVEEKYWPVPGSIEVKSDPTFWYWIIIGMQSFTIAILLYMLYGPIKFTTNEAQATVPAPKPQKVIVVPKPAPSPAKVQTKTIIVQDRSLLSTLCYTYGNEDACKKIVVALPSRVSPLRRYQY